MYIHIYTHILTGDDIEPENVDDTHDTDHDGDGDYDVACMEPEFLDPNGWLYAESSSDDSDEGSDNDIDHHITHEDVKEHTGKHTHHKLRDRPEYVELAKKCLTTLPSGCMLAVHPEGLLAVHPSNNIYIWFMFGA